jgi:hypothetical protein
VRFLFLPFRFGFLKITGLSVQAVFQNWVPRLGFRARDFHSPLNPERPRRRESLKADGKGEGTHRCPED